MSTLTPEMRRAIAESVNATFANPKATSAEVLDAMVGYMTINSVQFHTASGEMAVHLQAGAQALRAQAADEERSQRRFLGSGGSRQAVAEALARGVGKQQPCPVCEAPGYTDRCEACGHGEKGDVPTI